jgi:6,7-dimethyl-8-ribityllumazine synthase
VANILAIEPQDSEDGYAIVVAEWNRSITERLLEGALTTLTAGGVPEEKVDVAWVPGSWEIPLVAQQFALDELHSAVICLGAVIRGETSHDQHINRAVSMALQNLALESSVPILFGILTCETMEQAVNRAGGRVGNKGSECAEAALKMVGLLNNWQFPEES